MRKYGSWSLCKNSRGGIVVKEDTAYWINEDIIIRYNHVYDELQEGKPVAWGQEKAGIHARVPMCTIFIFMEITFTIRNGVSGSWKTLVGRMVEIWKIYLFFQISLQIPKKTG